MNIKVAAGMIRGTYARPSSAFFGFLVLVTAVASALALTFPALTGRVVDEAGILDPATKTALERKLADFETKTTGQLVVVTLKSLQGTSIEDYGYQLGRYWQIGQKDKNTGALLIIAPNERKVRIEVGYGFEGTLTDAVSKLIIENAIVPRLRGNDFAGGVNRGVDDIIQAVSVDSEEWKARARQRPDDEPGLFDVLALLFFLFIFFMVVSSVTRQGPGYGQAGTRPRRGSRGPIIMPIPGSWVSPGSSWSGGSSGGFWGGGGSFGGGGASGSFLLGRTDHLGEVAPPRPGHSIISSSDQNRIIEAIRAAEEKTAAEIFCVIAHACGEYRLVPIAWAAVIALAVPLPLIYLTSWPAGIIYLIQLTVFILTALVLSIAIIRFRIVPRRRMWERPHSEAMHQFLEQGAQLGEQHTGLLIFASVAERYAEIIAGSGINTKLAPEAWADAISTMISAIKDGRSADGLLAAANLCCELLARGLPPGPRSSKKTTGRLVEI
jgi:uncharacterized protein